jgi:hypothetical protein
LFSIFETAVQDGADIAPMGKETLAMGVSWVTRACPSSNALRQMAV